MLQYREFVLGFSSTQGLATAFKGDNREQEKNFNSSLTFVLFLKGRDIKLGCKYSLTPLNFGRIVPLSFSNQLLGVASFGELISIWFLL